jgi:hypothetical protein
MIERRRMTGFVEGPKVRMLAIPGKLRVTVRTGTHWLGTIALFGAMVFVAANVYFHWTDFPSWIRGLLLLVGISPMPLLVFQLCAQEIIEFDRQMLTIRKGIHRWVRKREYRIEDCRGLERKSCSKGKNSGLRCTVVWRTITFGHWLSGDDALEILTALRRNLPDVAQKICA